MKEEILKLVRKELETEIKTRIRENNYVKIAHEKGLIRGYLDQKRLDNNEYQFGKNVSVDWLRLEELPERRVRLHHVTWGTPLNIVIPPNRSGNNDPFHYISGRASDITFTWKYNEDGLPSISIKKWTLERDVEIKKY